MAGPAAGAPYRPDDDALVLERLSASVPLPSDAMPADLETATQRARAWIEQARASGDPRFLGYAEGALQPWSSELAPPTPVLLLRATLRQSRHDFAGAMNDLQTLLARDPGDVQALLTKATVLRVQGSLPAAAAACAGLRDHASEFVATLCSSAVRGLAGEHD
ncbi:MAG: hypothetical protein ACRES8_03105, partial [Nevskiaceae bacterium]